MKRTLRRVLTLLLALALLLPLSAPALAEDGQFSFTLTANGERETTVALGDRVKIALTVENDFLTDGEAYDLYTLQDYICYDRSFFDIDESSVVVTQLSGGDLFTASAVCFDGGDPDRVYVHRSSTTGRSVGKSLAVVSFELVTKKLGTSHVTHDTIEMLTPDLRRLAYTPYDATVIVGQRSYRVTAAAGAGGTISPSGYVEVTEGASQTFAIAASYGYYIQNVIVDGISAGPLTSYTFTNVKEPHTITALFQPAGGEIIDPPPIDPPPIDPPVIDPPVIDPPVVDPPVVDPTPVVDLTPVVDPPVVDPTPVVDPPAEEHAAPVIVDGLIHEIGAVEVAGDTTTVVVDSEALEAQLASASEYVSVPIAAETNAAAARFVVYDVERMSEKNMTLIVELDSVNYIIPAVAVDTDALDAAFPGVGTEKIPFVVTIESTPQAKNLAVSGAVAEAGGTLVLPAVDFTVTAQYGGKSVEVDVFKKYTARALLITAEQAKRITTAVVYEPDGSLRHVPTYVYQQGDQWYARVNSLTSSTYALIFNEAGFADARGMWYEAVVNEMASRKIINGRAPDVFDGGDSVTRAEFAAILVRALGLPESGGASAFTDVAAGAWYYGAVGKAYEYGLINGRGNGVFDPQASITREEAMAMVHRAAAITELTGATGDLSGFTDVESVSDWALADASWNVGSGLIQGKGNGLICAQDDITRGETATIILRLLQKSELVDIRTQA